MDSTLKKIKPVDTFLKNRFDMKGKLKDPSFEVRTWKNE